LAQELLVDNRHRVRLVMRPDQDLAGLKEAAEATRLAALKAQMDDDAKQQVIDQANALLERQNQQDDEGILPKVGREDIPHQMAYVAPTSVTAGHVPLTSYAAGTNGIVYQQIIIELPQLTNEQLDLLPIYAGCLTELGIGDQDYLTTQLKQSQICGSIHAYTTTRGAPDSVQELSGHLTLSAKGLATNQQNLSKLMLETLNDIRFDELPRIRELVAQARAHRENSITGNGHVLAMSAASAQLSPGARLAHRWGGMEGIRLIKAMDDSLADPLNMAALAEQLKAIHQTVVNAPKQLLLVADGEHLDQPNNFQSYFDTAASYDDFTPINQPELHGQVRACWLTNTQVNFCAKAYPTVSTAHPDAAALTVLGGFLRNGYLHRAIREQGGAYGGGASQDSHIGSFRFYSYRDPRIEDTLKDFDNSLQWLHNEEHEERQLEESVLGVISSIDKPGSPAGEARSTFHAELYGNNREKREQFRNRVLDVTIDDLKRVAQTYLQTEKASIAVITNPDRADHIKGLDLNIITL
jgi:Zn-dependent M16 (insulinase) family peptidase